MDSFEWNRLAGWVLAAAVAVLGVSIVAGKVYEPERAVTKGYKVEGVIEESAGAAPAEAEKPIAFFLAAADTARGEAGFKKCQSCHNAAKGGANGIGPGLWGVVGRPVGKHGGFAYSEAVAGHGGNWTWDELSAWLANPKKHIAGNKMAFAGIGKPNDRADIVAYLNTQSDAPLPLPAPPAETAAAPVADAAAAGAEDAKKGPDTATDGAAPAQAADARETMKNRIGGPAAADITGTAAREK